MMFNKQRETLQQVAGLYMPAWAVRASCIFSISESISMFCVRVCVRASQEESLLADRVAQLSSLCLKLPLGQSGLSERSSAGATLELACRGNQREDDALRTARAATGESNEMGKISVCSVCWKRVEGTEIQQWQSNLHGQICIQTIKKTTVHYWILLVKNVPSSDGAIPFKLILVE